VWAIAGAAWSAAEVAVPDPAPPEKILGVDAEGWIDHLKTHENEQERKIAMFCLADFGEAAAGAVPEILSAAKDELQPEMERWATLTLGAIGPQAKQALPWLLGLLADTAKPASHRAAACAAAAQIQPENAQVRKAVLAALRDASPEVRGAAIEALVMLAPHEPAAIGALARMVLLPADAPAAASALQAIGADGVDALQKALSSVDEKARLVVAEALGGMGGEAVRALPVILKTLKRERSPAVRSALTLAAARIAPRDPDVLQLMVERLAAPVAAVDADEKNPERDTGLRVLKLAGLAALPALQATLRSQDPVARLNVVQLLSKLPAESVLHDLLARAQDKDEAVQVAALKALEAYGPSAKAAYDALIEIARGGAQTPRARNAAELAALNVAREPGTPRIKSALASRNDVELLQLLKDPAPATRQDAAEVLRGRQTDAPAVAAALVAALSDPEEGVRIAAAKSLARFGAHALPALPRCLEWLASESIGLRKTALTTLLGLGESAKPGLPNLLDFALSALSDDDNEQQYLLSLVLSRIGEDAAQALTLKLKHEDAAVRARAARALAAMGAAGAAALPELIELSKSAVDSDAKAGFAAIQAIGPLAYAVAGKYLASVLSGDLFADRRKWAAWALGEVKAPADGNDTHKVIDALLLALLDPDEAVCRGAHGALTRIGAPALPKLREMLRMGEGEAPYWAVRVMARIKADPELVIPRLAELTQPGKRPVERGTAAELMGEYAPDHPEIIPVLLRVLSDREDYVARAAAGSLARFGGTALPALKKLLQHRSPLYRRRALEALGIAQKHMEEKGEN
jgi:HEAT repeat protein